MKILDLTIKKQWYDMILSGEKKEEYREIKPYWINRFVIDEYRKYSTQICNSDLVTEYRGSYFFDAVSKEFDAIKFTNGYSKTSPSFLIECNGIEIGKPKPKWCDIHAVAFDMDNGEYDDVFVIKLGEIIK